MSCTLAGAYNNPYIINFSKEKYNADNKNWFVSQDEKGVVYAANDIGMLEFDGIRWTLNVLPNKSTVRSLSVLSHNTIFTGSYEDFGRWDRDAAGKLQYTSLSTDMTRDGLENADFWRVWADSEKVYFQSFESIYVYDYKTVERLSIPGSALLLTKVGDEFWVQQMRGALYKVKGKQLEKIAGSDMFSSMDVRIILPYGENSYLLGTSANGIYIYDGVSFRDWNPTLSGRLRSKDLNCGIYTSRNTFLFGTILDGFYETDRNGNLINRISTANTLQNNTVLAVFEDNIGNIWAGLDRGISYICYLPKMSYYTDPKGHLGSVYESVFWNDKLFLATNQGVFYLNKDELNNTSSLENMRLVDKTQGQVWSFFVDGDRLLCCHNKGLKEIHKDLSVSEPYNINTGVFSMYEYNLKQENVFLFATYASVMLAHKNSGKVIKLDSTNLPVKKMEIDHLNNLWLENFNKGVYRCRLSDDLSRIEKTEYFGGVSSDGLPYKLKLFKVGGRVMMLGDNKFYQYDDITDKIVPNEKLNECFRMVKDLRQIVNIKDDFFWALTGTSTYKFFFDGYSARIIESFDIGGKGLSLNYSYENVSILNDSLNLICLDNGFLLYNNKSEIPHEMQMLSIPFLNSLKATNKNGDIIFSDLEKTPDIPFSHNNISFGFMAKNLLANGYSFQYKLEGIDDDWSEPQQTDIATYVRLPKGNYTFMIRTVDNLGNYSTPVVYKLTISPPWTQTYWAYLLYVLLFLTVLIIVWSIFLQRYRNAHLLKIRLREEKRLRRRNAQLQQEVEVKNAELFSQASFVIRRNELILKIKDELEDFYKKQNNKSLGSFYQKINLLLNENIDSEEDWKMFLINFEKKHTNFFKKLKETYPQLTANDLRLCACLKLNFDSKEIAALMNISVRAVENSRSRLRKKLNIPAQQQLNEFFLQF